MFSSKKIINLTAIFVHGFIGFLFVLKYSYVYTVYPVVISVGYVILYSAAVYLLDRTPFEKIKIFGKSYRYVWMSVAVIASIIFIYAVPRIGQIGRLPAIQDWIELYFGGTFPYNSPLTPSSFPALFFMSMPFYFIGNLGWLEVIGFALFFYFTIVYSNNNKEFALRNILLFMTPVIYYEFFVRCELFFNVTLLIALIFLTYNYVDPQKRNIRFLLLAVVFGIGLSTRSVVFVITAIFFLFHFRQNLVNMVLFGIISMTVFAAFLIPFMLWDINDFMNNGPFAIQSHLSHLPLWVVIFFFVISVYAGWASRDLGEVFFSSGVILFLLVTISFILLVFQYGFQTAFFEDKIDLSYYAFTIPLLLLSIKDYKVDRYLGKVYGNG